MSPLQASLSFTISQRLLKHMSIESVILFNQFILCHPLRLSSIFTSITVFSNESALRIRWPKYWSFSFSISPSNEYSGLISFRMDWFDLLAVRGLSRVFNIIVQKHLFFGAQPFYGPTLTSIHDYWKNHTSDYTDICWQSNGFAFNLLSRLVIAFLPRNKCLLFHCCSHHLQ